MDMQNVGLDDKAGVEHTQNGIRDRLKVFVSGRRQRNDPDAVTVIWWSRDIGSPTDDGDLEFIGDRFQARKYLFAMRFHSAHHARNAAQSDNTNPDFSHVITKPNVIILVEPLHS